MTTKINMVIAEETDLAKAKAKRKAKQEWKEKAAAAKKRAAEIGAFGQKRAQDEKNPGKEVEWSHNTLDVDGLVFEVRPVYNKPKGSESGSRTHLRTERGIKKPKAMSPSRKSRAGQGETPDDDGPMAKMNLRLRAKRHKSRGTKPTAKRDPKRLPK